MLFRTCARLDPRPMLRTAQRQRAAYDFKKKPIGFLENSFGFSKKSSVFDKIE
jgi:hypothetical protein